MSFIHENSLKILSEVGIRVDSPLALKYFAKILGDKLDSKKVLLPPEIVKWALESAPSNISIYSRTGDEAFRIGTDHSGNTIYGIGVTNTHFQDFETDNVVAFQRQHSIISAQLGDFLSEFDVISTIGIPSEVSPELADLYNTLDLYANSRKPLVILLAHDETIASVYDLMGQLNSNLREKPSFITYVNPVTPLVMNDSTVQKMYHSIELGCPVIFSNYSMYGATTPAPPVGTLCLMNAELLAGLLLSQLMREGAPMILGSLPASFDMTTMASPFTNETFLLNLACAEMMDYYRLPHCGTSGSGAGWGADLPACDMQWINHLTGSLGKVGLAPFVGGNFESLAFSPAMVIHANQIIRQIREFRKGLDLGDFSKSFQEIITAGPGGNFLTSDQTLEKMGSFMTSEKIWQGMTVEKWENLGKPNASDQLRKYVREVMNNLGPPEDSNEIVAKGEKLIQRLNNGK